MGILPYGAVFVLLIEIFLFEFPDQLSKLPKIKLNRSVNRTPTSSVRDGDTYHYATEDCLMCVTFMSQIIASVDSQAACYISQGLK